jgi:transcriptional regulator with XRE-family HTH domain
MLDNKTIGINLRRARLYRNYSQEYLASKLGISQKAYSRMELGYIKLTVDRLYIIADVLQVPMARLFEADDILAEVETVNQMPIVPKILEIICRATNMGFSAVAKVTDDRWIACSVRDEISFGLKQGGELQIETTICNEIRQSGKGVIIDHVAESPDFCHHHTPALYGFQSYISIPVFRQDGSFFGTLCAIDPNPGKLNNPETINMFHLFAELISLHLNTASFQSYKHEHDCKPDKMEKLYQAHNAANDSSVFEI